jgi:hypothetical protein
MSPEDYRGEAGRVRLLAAEQDNMDTARLLLLLAAEYDELADPLEGGESGPITNKDPTVAPGGSGLVEVVPFRTTEGHNAKC